MPLFADFLMKTTGEHPVKSKKSYKNNDSNKEFGKDYKDLPKLGSLVSRTRFNFEKSKS